MQAEDYPAQEPFTDIGARYHAEVMRRTRPDAGYEVTHGADPYQSLCVYKAENPTGDVLCVMHGGGWTNGYKEWMAFMAGAFVRQGVTFVTLGYRLAPQHVFPAGFEDCLDALAWVYGNIEALGGDRRRIFMSGHSAGGHYAALAALREDWQGARGLPSDVIRAALPISGTYYFGEGSGLSMRPRFLGEAEGVEARASPLSFVRANAPPFLLAVGDGDFPHLITQCQVFESKLRDAGVPVSCITLEGCDHLGASYASGEIEGEWPRQAVEFMRQIA